LKLTQQSKPADRLNDRIFNLIYSRSLVYNTCWEDPAIDRQALELTPDDSIMVITSAGCNVLDYAITGPRHIHAVDMNPRQNAVLELKIAGIRELEFSDFFQLFGLGRYRDFEELYRQSLRQHLSDFARQYWDKNYTWFIASSKTGGFYFHGLSGYVARSFHLYMQLVPGFRSSIEKLLATSTLDEQCEVFESIVQRFLWSEKMNWVLSRQLTMNMLGVPHPQRREVESQHADGVAGFIRESIEYVFRNIPLSINYFWRLYLQGHYTYECCPEYLKQENFYKLKQGLVDRISINTSSVTGFLKQHPQKISRFVLLDHMDWMSSYHPDALIEEWQAILASATDHARVIFRSAHKSPAYLQQVSLPLTPSKSSLLTDQLIFYPEKAESLQKHDRVHTYAGFHIADICV
jgi:S-adenosylmethionine-diacylglycerol 3-amino-3-carboxypropyl transferase